MTTSSLIRWSGLAAMGGGVLNVLDAIWHPPWMTMLMAVVIGLPSLAEHSLAELLGILGAAAVGLGLAGAGYLLWSSGATLSPARPGVAPG